MDDQTSANIQNLHPIHQPSSSFVQSTQLSDVDQVQPIKPEILEDNIPCNNSDEFYLLKTTMIADKIVFSMSSLDVPKETIKQFVDNTVQVHGLLEIHRQFLTQSVV